METVSRTASSKQPEIACVTYSLGEFARLLGISYTGAHEQAQRGTLPVKPLRLGRLYRFPKRDVHALLGLPIDYEPLSSA